MSELVRVSEILVCFNPEDTSLAQLSPYKLPVAAHPPTPTAARRLQHRQPAPILYRFHVPPAANPPATVQDAPAAPIAASTHSTDGGGATEARMKMLIRNEIACVLCGTQNQLESQAMQTCYRTDVASGSIHG